MSGPAGAVSWAPGGAPGPVPGSWAPQRRASLPVAGVLRLVSAGLAGLAGAFALGASFPALITVSGSGSAYRLSGWSEEATGLTADQVLLGPGLALAAVALLTGAALAAASVWRPRVRGAAIAVTVLGAALTVAQFWMIGPYLTDFRDLVRGVGADSLDASLGAGYWLLLTALVVSLLGTLVLALAAIPVRRKAAPAAPAPQWTAPPPVAGPADWTSESASWGGAR